MRIGIGIGFQHRRKFVSRINEQFVSDHYTSSTNTLDFSDVVLRIVELNELASILESTTDGHIKFSTTNYVDVTNDATLSLSFTTKGWYIDSVYGVLGTSSLGNFILS